MEEVNMLGRLRNSFAEVDLSALEQNYLNLKSALGAGSHCQMAPMVKADGYGHGDIQVARVCEKLGARYLGVALIEEGIKLRLAGIQTPILVFSTFDTIGADAIVKYRLTPVVGQMEQIQKLKNVLPDDSAYPVHVKFNTGMQRHGFEPAQAQAVGAAFENEGPFKLEGVCTHFASSEDFGVEGGVTDHQVRSFQEIAAVIKKKVQWPLLYHYMNSGAMLSGLQPQLDLARPGIALYGSLPKLRTAKPLTTVSPVMSVKSSVAFLHAVKKGARVSYGGTWEAKKDSVIAVMPIGYADGIPRSLSNRGRVLIRGESCPIAGIVCMDYVMADVTALAEKNLGPELGDEVVFLGKQKNTAITVEELAELAQTIPYEIMTGMQSRLPRVYIH